MFKLLQWNRNKKHNYIPTTCSNKYETDEIDEAIENTDEIESANSLSFSKAIEMITNIIYTHENRDLEKTLHTHLHGQYMNILHGILQKKCLHSFAVFLRNL